MNTLHTLTVALSMFDEAAAGIRTAADEITSKVNTTEAERETATYMLGLCQVITSAVEIARVKLSAGYPLAQIVTELQSTLRRQVDIMARLGEPMAQFFPPDIFTGMN